MGKGVVVSAEQEVSEGSYHVGRHRKRLVRVFVVRWTGVAVGGVVFSKIRISHVAVHSFMPLYFHTVRTTDNIDIIQSGLDGPDSVRISEVPD